MPYYALLGYAGGTFTTVALVPEIVKVIRIKKADQLSYAWLSVLLAGIVLWTLYGIALNNAPLIIANATESVLCVFLIGLKTRYKSAQ
ncbi:MAG: SemiSWEET family transporter [Candidatus Micrarchaeaceae archaeon]